MRPTKPSNSPDYERRKGQFERCLTVYGRNAVLEALRCPGVVCERLHLAQSNRPAAVLEEIIELATAQDADVQTHAREALARISRNAREDQGVAADLRWPGYRQLADLLVEAPGANATLLAVDGITNPQNLGMLIRSATAGGVSGILVPRRGGCDIGPLVIKASAGSLFRATVLRCDTLPHALERLAAIGWRIAALASDAGHSLFEPLDPRARVYVLGGETQGVSPAVLALAHERVAIPMQHGVESLNVAVAAALVAYRAGLAQRA